MSELPEIFFDILGPVAVLVALGVAAGKWLGTQAEPLAKLAFWIFGPAFMFDSLANAGLAGDALVRVAAASALAVAAAGLVALILTARLGRARRATIVTASMYGNTGNFGIAIVVFTFDDRALPYAAIALVTVNTIGIVVGVASATGGIAGLRRAATTPMTMVVLPALVVNGTGATLPPILDRSVGLLAAAIIPVMLITLGVQLQQMGIPTLDGDVVRALVGKLVVQPMVAVGAVAALGLGSVAGGAVVLQAAMPAAVFTAVLAIEEETRPDEAATIVLLGSLVAVFTLPWFIMYVR